MNCADQDYVTDKNNDTKSKLASCIQAIVDIKHPDVHQLNDNNYTWAILHHLYQYSRQPDGRKREETSVESLVQSILYSSKVKKYHGNENLSHFWMMLLTGAEKYLVWIIKRN